ncbi:MAG: PQQ-binding-like beta-propeller repeat protein [Ardenticatenaceae bacterium]|nr:PQQ-binding-like beta-propeller repeat protein [Ardenticatenaceae bacterium]
MAAHDGHLFLLGDTGYAVTQIDTASGEGSRGYLRYRAPYSARASTLHINSGVLLIGFYGTQKIGGEIAWGAGKIVALDAPSGELFWETKIPGARSITTMNACGETIGVNGSFTANDYVLELKTGAILRETEQSRDSFIRFIDQDTIYKVSEDSPLAAYRTSDQALLWSVPFQKPIYQPILCKGDLLFIRTYKSDQVGTVYAVQRATGEIKWEVSSVTSNVDVYEGHAFFFTTDKKLLAVDTASGEIDGEIQFDYPMGDFNDPKNAYTVAADEDLVFVYFHSSDQLFAFKLNQDGGD